MELEKLYRDIPLSINQIHSLTGIKKPTLRYWEKVFSEYLNPNRTEGNQRYYDQQDLARIVRIKHLLFEEKYTIAGAKRQLELREKHPAQPQEKGR